MATFISIYFPTWNKPVKQLDVHTSESGNPRGSFPDARSGCRVSISEMLDFVLGSAKLTLTGTHMMLDTLRD